MNSVVPSSPPSAQAKHPRSVDDVIVEGNIAVVRAHAAGTGTLLAANTTIPMPDHRELFVLRRANAEWRISEYMFNTTVSKGHG